MRVRQLTCFIRACELGSISRAATELRIAQPALGLQIRGLEAEFSSQLIVRSSRGVAPTPTGEIVLNWARDTLDRLQKARSMVKELQMTMETPTVTVGLTASLTVLLASVMIDATRSSQIKLKLVEGFSRSVAEWLDEGRIDIGLGFGPFAARAVQSIALMRERLYYISAPGEGNDPITLAEVLGRPLAVPDEQNSIRNAVEAAARTIDMPVFGHYEIGSLQAAREIAKRGLAGAIVGYGAVASDRRSGELSVRLLVEPTVERNLYLMHRSDRAPNVAEQVLIELIVGALRNVAQDSEYAEAYALIDDLRAAAGDQPAIEL